MSNLTRAMMMGAAGAASDPTYVDDVFSTTLYEANGSASPRTITNGIDLAGNGGLVWTKARNQGDRHALVDDETGIRYHLHSNEQDVRDRNWFNSFNSDGYTFSTSDTELNYSDKDYVSWTFRKAPGFFDVVTYTGTGSARTVAHNLGSVPGMILIKSTSSSSNDWSVYHRSMGATKNMHLNTTAAADTQTGVFNDTEPTSTHFTVNYDGDVNGSGKTYVAYVFAHDDASFGTDGDESIIKCGTYGGNNGTQEINLGFEPQFLLIKNTTNSNNWVMLDVMRGAVDNDTNQSFLYSNTNDIETWPLRAYVTTSGFGYKTESSAEINGNGNTYIYMAIRRPNKPPESGTDVFHAYYGTPASNSTITTGFPIDMQIAKEASSANAHRLFTRKLGLNTWKTTGNYTKSLQPAGNDEGQIGNLTKSVGNTTFGMPTAYANNLMIYHSFKRAPGFMDIITYRGTGSNYTSINHGLGVVPEMFVIKREDTAGSWATYHKDVGAAYQLYLDTDAAKNSGDLWQDTGVPTSTQFFTHARSTTNASGGNYVGYFFATLPGISKVGSYTGTGNAINVDCGFTNGARFILIKRTDASGNWFVWDYARGITSGNDPYFLLETNAAESTNTDYIDPLPAGFTITSAAAIQTNDIAANGGTYIFLAIA